MKASFLPTVLATLLLAFIALTMSSSGQHGSALSVLVADAAETSTTVAPISTTKVIPTTKRKTTSKRRTTSRKKKTTSKRKTTTKKNPFPWPTSPVHKKGLTVAVISTNEYCLMFPDNPTKGIGNQEQTSHVKCTAGLAAFWGEPLIPKNFIQSFHLARNGNRWIQLTGRFNMRVPFNGGILNTEDGGGQYDSHGQPDPSNPSFLGSPHNSICAGWDRYVHLWDEGAGSEGKMCIRCCSGPNADNDCNWRDSAAGCPAIIPGIY